MVQLSSSQYHHSGPLPTSTFTVHPTAHPTTTMPSSKLATTFDDVCNPYTPSSILPRPRTSCLYDTSVSTALPAKTPPLPLNRSLSPTRSARIAMSYWMYPSPLSSLGQPDDVRASCLGLPLALPYEVETLEEMDDRLEFICCKLAECIKAREWNMGFSLWDNALELWISMGYPMKKEMKIRLIFLFWEVICESRFLDSS